MADISKVLGSKFVKTSRYPNFGACVNSMKIEGFRGVGCQIEIEYPVTAITGLNGSGKSTVGQLALCAYRQLSTAYYKRFYVKDFFPVSVVDPSPFEQNAAIEYKYQTSNANEDQGLRIYRVQKEWGGYKRQPEKAAIYIGLAFYLPKVERRDLTIYSAKNIVLSNRAEVENGAMWASRILGNTYSEVFFQGVQSATRSAELGMASRLGAKYSENNMGFGEGRVIHTIRLLESCPAQSLVVLEEPETSLHENAQYEFSKYLMDVSSRRGHQIIYSTHSSAIINALPTIGRKMLVRTDHGVSVVDGLSSSHIRNALTEGKDGHLVICVEDDFAKSFLQEIFKLRRNILLRRVKIIAFGDANAVRSAVNILKKAGIKAVAVRDGDQPEIPQESIFSLPGGAAPERVVMLSPESLHVLQSEYNFNLQHRITANPNLDHHEYSSVVSESTGCTREVIEADCIRAFISAQPSVWAEDLMKAIESGA